MRLKSIIIDGFKSYAYRTEIGPFDETFNAITGFNGSGKSNILDAICFVMGISSSSMRARTLQELIHGNGTSGIKKAMVTLIFDNRDKKKSPPSFEDCAEITVTRSLALLGGGAGPRNKYLINGHPVQQKQVDTLFRDVHLNVNNPHFLIMQGRITKVLSMKPMEVLSMLEETAGTKQYDEECARTRLVFEKKDRKIAEINAVITDEIEPKLEKLKEEQLLYERFQEREKEAEDIRRILTAHQYLQLSGRLNSSHLEELQAKIQQLQDSRAAAEERIGSVDGELEVACRANREMEASISQLAELFSAQENEAIDQEQELSHLREQQEQDEATLASLTTSLVESQNALSQKQRSSSSSSNSSSSTSSSSSSTSTTIESPADLVTRLQSELALADRRFEAAQSGAGDVEAGAGSSGKSMGEELVELQQAVSSANTLIKKLQTRETHVGKQLADKRHQVQGFDQRTIQMKEEHAQMAQQIRAKEAAVAALPPPVDGGLDLDQAKAQLVQRLRALQSESERLGASLAHTGFKHKPSPHIRDEAVHGRVSQLVAIKDTRHATALEVAAGGKLHNVVVDSMETAKTLIKVGEVARTTFMPLDSIKDSTIPVSAVTRASALARERGATCVPAISVVEAHPRHPDGKADIPKALRFVFGGALICDEKEARGVAKDITFDPQVRRRTITLEGDVYDPQGTVSGGYRQEQSQDPLLLRATRYRQVRAELEQAQGELRRLEQGLAGARQQRDERARLEEELDLLQHRAGILQADIDRSPQQQLHNEIARCEAELAEFRAQGEQARDTIAQGRVRIEALQQRIAESKSRQAAILAEVKAQRQQLLTALKAAKEVLRTATREEQQRALECQALLEEIGGLERQKAECEAQVAERRAKIDELAAQLKVLRGELAQIKAQLKGEKEALQRAAKSHAELEKSKAASQRAVSDANVQLSKVGHQIEQYERENATTQQQFDQLEAENPWIESQKRFFGVAGSEYDFQAVDIRQQQQALKELEQVQTREGSRINRKVLAMYQTVRAEAEKLVQKRDTLRGDRDQIEAFMRENNERKRRVLTDTYQSVNESFGQIFAQLLPNSRATLEPTGATFQEGLRFRVAFGQDAWKESLTELSGGQRSLLALSLVLALLLTNPSPMYILDEIDSALDLSHTQNIGSVIQNPRFGGSQFIIVSLKEGMFNNANVLFRTKLVDGASTVSRMALK